RIDKGPAADRRACHKGRSRRWKKVLLPLSPNVAFRVDATGVGASGVGREWPRRTGDERREANRQRRTLIEDALRTVRIEEGRLIEAVKQAMGWTCSSPLCTQSKRGGRRWSASSPGSTPPVVNSLTANHFMIRSPLVL